MAHRVNPWMLAVLLGVCGFFASARAASLYTETFDSSTGGWQDLEPGKFVVTNQASGGNPGGCLVVTYPPNFGFPEVGPDAVVATGASSTVNFIGNYVAAGASLIGFDFRAENSIPLNNANIKITLFSRTNSYERLLGNIITSTGTWFRIRIPLLAPELGGWTNVVGEYAGFGDALTNITTVRISIGRAGEQTTTESYRFDNIFLGTLPRATAIGVGGTAEVAQVWSDLRIGETFHFEAAHSHTSGIWSIVETFQATSAVYQTSHTATHSPAVYRLRMD